MSYATEVVQEPGPYYGTPDEPVAFVYGWENCACWACLHQGLATTYHAHVGKPHLWVHCPGCGTGQFYMQTRELPEGRP